MVAVVSTRRRAGIVEADTIAVKDAPHPARNHDPCPHSDRCGGCDWPHINPDAGPRLKARAAADAARGRPAMRAKLARAPIVESPLNYRLRARLHWDPTARRLGFYEVRSHRVTDIPSCRILSPELMAALPLISDALARRCPQPIDVDWLQGMRTSNPIAGLRTAKGNRDHIDPSWIPRPDDVGESIAGFHILDRGGEAGEGWGETTVTMELPIPLVVPIGSFFQGNRHLIGPLFRRVGELAGDGGEPVYDLHAGVGFLAAAVVSTADRETHLVEPHRVAARAAASNLPTAEVAVGTTAEDFVASGSNLPEDALVITDPPRSGMTKSLRRALADWRPRRMLMLGCDPATWARDAGFLTDIGYAVQALELFDLFPSTHHVEILALLERS
jgi:tRNA/tmRNA/rRNA uracil-C5-methylase (TrmA/RlmC/RlmD family)